MKQLTLIQINKKNYYKEYYEKNKEKIKNKVKKYREENKEIINKKRKKYREENKEKIKEQKKKYRLKYQQQINKKRREYYEKNKEKHNKKVKEWQEKNIKKVKEYKKKYVSNLTPEKKLCIALRGRLATIVRRKQKSLTGSGTKELLKAIGCSLKELRKHLENNFKQGMSWQNYGKWHIDHIIPLATVKTVEDAYKLNHYSNLQPLWAEENLKKHAKIENFI